MEILEEFIKDEYLEGYDYMNHLYLVSTNNFENITKVKIVVESHDQGWSSDEHSWTWGEINILDKYNKEKKKRINVYTNITSSSEWKIHKYIIEDKDYLNNIKNQDKICLWIRSLYPGWKNYIKKAKIIIYGNNKITNNQIKLTKFSMFEYEHGYL